MRCDRPAGGLTRIAAGAIMKIGRLIVRTALIAVAFLSAPLVAHATQDQPDFSGSWVLQSGAQASADIPQSMSVSQTLVRTNVRGEPMDPFYRDIKVTRAFESGTRSERYPIGGMGGTVPGVSAGGILTGVRTHYRVAWAEHSLVIETGSYTGEKPESGEWSERREVWSLEPDGRLRLAITTRSSVDDSRTMILVYRRQ